MAPNEQSIRNWIKNHRTDIPERQVDAFIENQGVFGLMAMAFEAGRDFQTKNPSAGEMLSPFDTYAF